MSPRRAEAPESKPPMNSLPPLAPPKAAQPPGELAVFLADVEPVASFIATVAQADALIKHMRPADLRLIPALPLQGIQMLQAAVRRLRQAGVPAPEGTADDVGAGGDNSSPGA